MAHRPPPESASQSFDIVRWTPRAHDPVIDHVVSEEPLEIRVRAGTDAAYSTLAITMRTPGHDVELALGFLHGEGLIEAPSDVLDARPCLTAPNIVQLTLRAGLDVAATADARRFYTTSSCGLCGRSSLEAVAGALKGRRVTGTATLAPAVLAQLPQKLRALQPVFDATGGLHGCGLFDRHGGLLWAREDVGRHNAVDKLLGRALADGRLPAIDCVLVLSGRAGFELIQKAVMAGVSAVAAVGAPTSLAIELARRSGQTLVGFLAPSRFNVYAGGERIAFDATLQQSTPDLSAQPVDHDNLRP